MSFNRSTGCSFSENTFNHAHGHQVNGTINVETVNLNAGQVVVKRTEYDQFQEVIRGDIVPVKELYSEGLTKWDCFWRNGKLFCRRKSAQKTIYTVELIDRQSKFTAMIYEGEGAHDAWEDDFRRFSQIKDLGSFRLFGINQSAIPALIFHHELIPLTQIFTGSIWMNIYVQHLSSNMGCDQYSLWMNTTSGMLSSGPEGPFFSLGGYPSEPIVVPRTVDMLKDDTSFRFFSKFGSTVDNSVLACARWCWKTTFLDDLVPVTTDQKTEDSNHPACLLAHPYVDGLWRDPPCRLPMDDIGVLRFDTVYSPSLGAVTRRPQEVSSLWMFWTSCRRGLVDETALDGGLTRFKFDPTQGGEVYLNARYSGWDFWLEWLSQSCRVFDALDVTEGEENFFVVNLPDLKIRSTTCPNYERLAAPFGLCDGKLPVEGTQLPPIYLFFRPLPMTISEFVSWMNGRPYFWSLSM